LPALAGLAARSRLRPPRALLSSLAARHGLTRKQARLCWRLGCRLAPTLPLSMFLRPSLWEVALVTGRVDAATAASIRARLFSR
jgi:hypothetical protein